MVTLTMRHRKGQSLAELWGACSAAWGRVTSGRAWVDDCAAAGLVGWTRVVEVTHGANGWHVHVHALMFFDGSGLFAPDLDGFASSMFQRWRSALVARGLEAPLARHGGLDARWCYDGASSLGEYFAKAQYSAGQRAGFEMAGQGKGGRLGNRTPFELLRDVVETGCADSLDLWHEYEAASRGRRQLTWARGFRATFDIELERTDEEIAEETLDGEDLVLLEPDVWRAVRYVSDRLLEAAEADDTGAQLRALLRELLGLNATGPGPNGPGPRWAAVA